MKQQPNDQDRYSRNFGFINAVQQAKLANARIVIAGVGGVGGRVATELVRLGCTKLRLADPDIFTTTNLNRQEGAYQSTLGRPKVEVIAELCRDINPEVDIELFADGVSDANIDVFIADATIIVEATDFMLPHLGVMIARRAREAHIPVVMGVEIGFGATVTWFDPYGSTYEKYFGLKPGVTLAELERAETSVDIGRWLPHVPSYGDLSVLRRVTTGGIDVPAIAPAVGICAALISTQILSYFGGRNMLPAAPAVFYFDAKEHRGRIIRHPVWHHRWSLAVAVMNNYLGRYDKM